MKKITKYFMFFSMMIASFVGISANKDVEVVNAALTKDYSNLTFDAGDTSIPSGYFYNGNTSGAPIIESNISGEGYNFATGILITKGGESKFPFQASKPTDSKRYMGFTLYENVELEIGLFTEGSSDDFYIADTSKIIHTETFTKKVEHHLVYNFKNVSSSGSDYYFGGTSNYYVTYIHWGESLPKAYFDANGGVFSDGSSRMSSIKEGASNGDLIDKVPDDPTHPEGNEFLGWATTKDAVAPNATSFKVGETYYAVWGEPVAQAIHIVYNGSTSSTSLTLKQGQTTLLSYQVAPANTTAGTIEWTSSNPSVVTVTQNGFIEAVGVGEATITISGLNGKISDSIKITVQETKTYVVTFIANDVTREVTVYEDNFVENDMEYKGTIKIIRMWTHYDGL